MARRPGSRPAVSGRLVADVWQHLRARDQRPRPARPENRRLKVVNSDDGATARIDLMDEIGYWGTTAQDFVDELLAIDAATIELHLNSPGGDVFDGVAIMNALADHPATVNVVVDALAASAASFVAMAGDSVKMNRGSQMMIHDASGFAYGNASDMTEMASLLDRVSDMIAELYADRAGESTEHWRDLMRAETWYSAAEAVEAGLADESVSGPKAAPDEGDGEEEDPDEEPAEGEEPEEDPDESEEDPDEESDDEDEDEEELDAPAARFAAAFATFRHAGRGQAPAPPIPGRRPAAFQFDPDAFRAAFKEGLTS